MKNLTFTLLLGTLIIYSGLTQTTNNLDAKGDYKKSLFDLPQIFRTYNAVSKTCGPKEFRAKLNSVVRLIKMDTLQLDGVIDSVWVVRSIRTYPGENQIKISGDAYCIKVSDLKDYFVTIKYEDKDFVRFIAGARILSENDVYFPMNNWDQNYTGQFRFEIFTKGILDKGWGFPFPINRHNPEKTSQSIFFNGMGYTPARRYFSSTLPVYNDRPYAALICFGYQRSAQWNNVKVKPKINKKKKEWDIGDIFWTTETALGKMGGPAAGKVQNFLHEYIAVESVPVLGWQNQIGNPGRFVWYVRGIGSYYPNIGEKWPTWKGQTIRPGLFYEGITGTFMRYNKLGITFGNNIAPLGGGIPTVPSTSQSARKIKCVVLRALYYLAPNEFEVLPSVKFVGWNSTLSGHPIEDYSIHTISPELIKDYVPELAIRGTWHFMNNRDNRRFSLYYAINWRGEEYEGGSKSHFFGSVGLCTMKIRQ